jgi:surface protein
MKVSITKYLVLFFISISIVLTSCSTTGEDGVQTDDNYIIPPEEQVPMILIPFDGTVAEDATVGMQVGQLNLDGLDSATKILSIALSGEGNENFVVDNTGAISVSDKAVLDYETKPLYTFVATVINDAGGSRATIVNIKVTNSPEVKPILLSFSGSVVENAPKDTVVGQITIQDQGDEPITAITLSGEKSQYFSVDANGTIKVTGDALLDYETLSTYNLIAQATNSAGNSDPVSVKITLTNVGEVVPTLESFAASIYENSKKGTIIGSVSIKDSGDSAITAMRLEGNGNENCTVSTTGVISVAADNAIDYENISKYNLSVIASNGAGDSLPVAVVISVINEEDIVPIIDNFSGNLNENSTAGTQVGKITIVSSGDSAVKSMRLSGIGSDDFSVTQDGTISVSSIGDIDYEKQTSYNLEVVATNNAGSSVAKTVTISVNNLEDIRPTIDSFTTSVNENFTGVIGKINIVSSGDSAISKIVISGEGSDKFTIVKDGTLSVVQALDYESQTQFRLSLVAYNKAGASSAKDLTILVNNQEDILPVLENFTGSVAENSSAGTLVGKVVVSTKGDSDITRMELSGDGVGNFTIDKDGTIALSASANLDYETKASYLLKATAYNSGGASNSVDVTISIIDQDSTNPTLNISSTHEATDPLGASLDGNKDWIVDSITYIFNFSEDVTGFDIDDIKVTNATKESFSGSGDEYSVVIKPTQLNSTATITLSVDANSSYDSENNGNKAAQITQAVDTYVPFITVWKTNNSGTSNSQQVKLTTQCSGNCDYNIDWGDDSSSIHVEGNITHTYSASGTYTIKIKGEFAQLYMDTVSGYDPQKLLEVKQWGSIEWKSMKNFFKGCKNLTITAQDRPDLSQVTTMESMFYQATSFNNAIESWDVSTVMDMSYLFYNASEFNQDLSNWSVANVTNMSKIFYGASKFNGNLASWDVSKVSDMSSMFYGASKFNQDISNWIVSNVEDMSYMFKDAKEFNQDIAGWDTSSVTTMYSMFYRAESFSNHDLSAWDVSSVTSHSFFSYGWGSGNTEPSW